MAAVVVVVGSIHQSISNEGKNWSKSSRWKSCLSLPGVVFLHRLSAGYQTPPAPACGFLCNNSAPSGEAEGKEGMNRGGPVDVAELKYLHLSHFQHS